MLCTDKVIGMVAAGQHAQTAAVAREWVEVERNLHCKELVPVAVGMPSGISAVVVSVSTGVVKAFAEHFGLYDRIRFETSVLALKKLERGWLVTHAANGTVAGVEDVNHAQVLATGVGASSARTSTRGAPKQVRLCIDGQDAPPPPVPTADVRHLASFTALGRRLSDLLFDSGRGTSRRRSVAPGSARAASAWLARAGAGLPVRV